MQQTGINEFLTLAQQYPVLDVRSPGEYSHAHIPCAYSLPLFSDEERRVVGTAYKQEGREAAIKTGLDYFGVKMRRMVEKAEEIIKAHKLCNPDDNPGAAANGVLVHCWRGGMRSAGVAWLLDLYGFKVYTLCGGYKSYRNWVLQQFERPYPFKILGGYTGSGKTEVLKEMAMAGHAVINIERIAAHKGSAFGALGEASQPSQEMFENELGAALCPVSNNLTANEPIWLEDESRRVGLVNLPGAMWSAMQQSPLYFLDIPFEERLNYITEEYGRFKKEELVSAIMRIQKRLGGLNAKNAVNYLLEDNYKECFGILLGYYDKCYARGLESRSNADQFITITSMQVDAKANSTKLLQFSHIQE